MEKFKAFEVLGEQKVREMIELLELSNHFIASLSSPKESSLEFITLLSKSFFLTFKAFLSSSTFSLDFMD